MLTQNRLNAYRIMWLFVFFDLPTNTKRERSDATHFRKNLEKDGFTMMQYSVYIRHCPSRENLDVHIKRVKCFIPDKGQVSMLSITDKQYSEIINYWGAEVKPLGPTPVQLELF